MVQDYSETSEELKPLAIVHSSTRIQERIKDTIEYYKSLENPSNSLGLDELQALEDRLRHMDLDKLKIYCASNFESEQIRAVMSLEKFWREISFRSPFWFALDVFKHRSVTKAVMKITKEHLIAAKLEAYYMLSFRLGHRDILPEQFRRIFNAPDDLKFLRSMTHILQGSM